MYELKGFNDSRRAKMKNTNGDAHMQTGGFQFNSIDRSCYGYFFLNDFRS
jgi:hypothetical protein